ncbi:MAG TPA: hypothetical protein VMT61_03975 [Candidatus Binataceae bacterium]|nr:hypothetical protein [Candidatus Binataceae bacterium]
MATQQLTLMECRRLLAMATAQNDPVGIEHWRLEILKRENPHGYAAALVRLQQAWRDEAERRG